jgi:hypothetical protein
MDFLASALFSVSLGKLILHIGAALRRLSTGGQKMQCNKAGENVEQVASAD